MSNMNMVEALEWAAEFAKTNQLFVVTNERGYADKISPPTPAEKAKIIKELAETVISPRIEQVANLCDHGFVLCARCDMIPSSWKLNSL